MSPETDGGDMTLAVELAAAEALADPGAAFADAHRWSRHVGVVAEDAAAARSFVRRHRIRQDFELGDLDRRSVLSKLLWEADTDRYVFVGATDLDRALADHVGWEYLPVEEAAAKADWPLEADAGLIDRVRIRLGGLSPWRP